MCYVVTSYITSGVTCVMLLRPILRCIPHRPQGTSRRVHAFTYTLTMADIKKVMGPLDQIQLCKALLK